ncbi:MAG TPA: hypothetical protein DCG54_00315 [Anaerolineae bacterium]|jgi:hypothetical protein|nr:hypothetical protein [Anaerolineae bacterium]
MLEIRFGSDALDYLHDELAHGLIFCTRFLKLHSLKNGSVSSFVPEKTTFPLKFSDGLYWPEGISKNSMIKDAIAKFILDSIKRENGYIIAETAQKLSDIKKIKPDMLYFVYAENVYFYLDSRCNLEDISDLMRVCVPYVENVIGLTSLPHAEVIRPMQEITTEIFEVLVRRTTQLIVQAFDDDGYLIWSHQNIKDEPVD